MYRIRHTFIKVIASIIASIAYKIDSFYDHYRGPSYIAAIQEYDNFLRSEIKHTDHQGSYEDARDELWQQFKDRGLTIWDRY